MMMHGEYSTHRRSLVYANIVWRKAINIAQLAITEVTVLGIALLVNNCFY